jgi:bifunctional pyridoxal-dependent enzyme with beta-cystathionase and maltose regulon repressor activities
MKTALWIIAVCEVVRAVQNFVQIMTIRHDTKGRDNAYAEFVKSLKATDREWVRRLLDEFEKQEGE